jgi:hypothetical protein
MAERSISMIKLITGKKGTGKTKILIDTINQSVETNNGCIVSIEKGYSLGRAISRKVRKIDTEEFNLTSYNDFYGFVAGLMAGNYDINEIYVDGIFKIAGRDTEDFGAMLDKLATLSKGDVTITFTVSADNADLPESVTKFLD